MRIELFLHDCDSEVEYKITETGELVPTTLSLGLRPPIPPDRPDISDPSLITYTILHEMGHIHTLPLLPKFGILNFIVGDKGHIFVFELVAWSWAIRRYKRVFGKENLDALISYALYCLETYKPNLDREEIEDTIRFKTPIEILEDYGIIEPVEEELV